MASTYRSLRRRIARSLKLACASLELAGFIGVSSPKEFGDYFTIECRIPSQDWEVDHWVQKAHQAVAREWVGLNSVGLTPEASVPIGNRILVRLCIVENGPVEDSLAIVQDVLQQLRSELTSLKSAHTEKTKRQNKGRSNPLVAVRRKVIRRVSEGGVRGEEYCLSLDAELIALKMNPPTPASWRANGCPKTYQEAYKNLKWRPRIQDEKYKATHALPLANTRK